MRYRFKKNIELNDTELIKLLGEKHKKAEAAFNVFYHRYNVMILSYFLDQVKNKQEAEDLHQQVFEKFIAKVRTGFIPENAKAYLFKTARNVLINSEIKKTYRNAENRIPRKEFIEEIENLDAVSLENFDKDIENQELIELIRWALELLDKKYSEPLSDRFFYDYSVADIAEKYNLSYDGAKKRIARAKEKIKFILKPIIDEIQN